MRTNFGNEFIQYLIATQRKDPDCEHLPSLKDLSRELGISVASLREQVEVARALGLVEVRPRTGIRRLPYSFLPAARASLFYAIGIDQRSFEDIAMLRNHLEAAYWREAVALLTPQDHAELRTLVERAWEKLEGDHIQIPHAEHRQMHLGIFRRLNNPFVLGLLEAYWDAYEAVGLNTYTSYDYLRRVWEYHQQIVEAIGRGDVEAGYRLLVEHSDMLYHLAVISGADVVARPVVEIRNGHQNENAQSDGLPPGAETIHSGE